MREQNDENVLATELAYHLCILVNHEVHDGREEKQGEMPGTAGADFYDTSLFFVLFHIFMVQPGFSPKLCDRDNWKKVSNEVPVRFQ